MTVYTMTELRAVKPLADIAPGPTYAPELTLADKEYNDIVADEYYLAMTGKGDFWRGDYNEEPWAMFAALQEASALIAASDGERWRYLMRKLSVLVDDYAQGVAECKVDHI